MSSLSDSLSDAQFTRLSQNGAMFGCFRSDHSSISRLKRWSRYVSNIHAYMPPVRTFLNLLSKGTILSAFSATYGDRQVSFIARMEDKFDLLFA